MKNARCVQKPERISNWFISFFFFVSIKYSIINGDPAIVINCKLVFELFGHIGLSVVFTDAFYHPVLAHNNSFMINLE